MGRWLQATASRFTQYLQGATSQKTAFFIVTAVETSNLTYFYLHFVEIIVYTVLFTLFAFHSRKRGRRFSSGFTYTPRMIRAS
jgi:hypothetical protein